MTLENTSTQELINLNNLLCNDNDTYEEWLEAFNDDDQIRSELIDNITSVLQSNNYDGPNDYHAIYWFAKGLKLPAPKTPKRYVDSDKYLFNNLHKLKVHDKLNDFNRQRIHHKFQYQKMLNELINNKPILRPLPPSEMKELKPYHQQLFEAENKELIDFFNNFGHEFQSKDVSYLVVNIPHDYDTAERLLIQHRKQLKDNEVVTKNQNKDPILVYYLNQFSTLEDIFNHLENVVFKSERKPFKLTFELSGIFEIPVKQNDEVTRYNYEKRAINPINYKYSSNIPITVQMNTDIEKIKFYIESVLHNYEVSDSATKLTLVSSVAFTVHRLVKVTGKLNLPDEIIKSKLIITDNVDDSLCWYRFLAVCLKPSLLNYKKYKLADRTAYAKRLVCEEHGHSYTTKISKEAQKFLDKYDGTTMEEMKKSAEMHKINVNI